MPGANLTPHSRMLIAGASVFAADRLSNLWVVEWLDLEHLGRIEVAAPYLNFVMAWNRGINFGIGAGGPEMMRWVLIGLAVAISAALVWWVRRRGARAKDDDTGADRTPALAWGAGVIIGGALGNAVDRLHYGAVADFLNVSCCGIDNPYAFNIADLAIFAGAALIAFRA